MIITGESTYWLASGQVLNLVHFYSRHLDCLSSEQRMKLRKQHTNAAALAGFKDLRPGDKARVLKCIGWSEEAHDTSDSRSNNRSKYD